MDKKNNFSQEITIVVASVIFFIFGIFIGGSVLSSEGGNVINQENQHNHQQQDSDPLPDDMIQGTLSSLNLEDGFIMVTIEKPEMIAGKKQRVEVSSGTTFKNLKLEVLGLDDVRDKGTENISSEELTEGDDLLVSLNSQIEDIESLDDNPRALVVTKITEI